MLLDVWFEATQICRRSSLGEWLLGVLLTLVAGLILYVLGGSGAPVQPPSMAKSGQCLQAAGFDPKHGELLARDPSCTCAAAN